MFGGYVVEVVILLVGTFGFCATQGRSLLDLSSNAPQERIAELITPSPETPRTRTRCSFCGEEVIGQSETERCGYCGANLSLSLGTTTVVRSAEREGGFTEDTPASFIRGGNAGH
jgi:hypothetical protein